ncbi:hypothetical protein M8C21_029222 [Ambrosia artemisiifolia]|uniref:Uncharacterized protein n=1 Tax=Ambrosia artemisiifolia TaxID=4212 RepID=A0AAD5D4H2_AMBAR|nr:hypothetical protein M8C21_029222 [Ambrosia artemisiifolia]
MEFNEMQKDVKEENGSQHMAIEGRNNGFIKHSKRGGGWTTFPFILGGMLSLTLTAGGWIGNLIVYLITKYNVKSIDATQVFNVVVGCMSLFPIVAAVLSDSFCGSFTVVTIFSFVSLLVYI